MVAGKNGTGKYTVSYLLKEFFETKGFEVNLAANQDFSTEKDFLKTIGDNIEDRVSAVNKKTKLYIKEVPLSRYNFDDFLK